MKKIQFNAVLYFHNERGIKKKKLQFFSVMIISVLKKSNMKNEFKILTFKLPLTIHYQNLLSRKNKYVAQKLFG